MAAARTILGAAPQLPRALRHTCCFGLFTRASKGQPFGAPVAAVARRPAHRQPQLRALSTATGGEPALLFKLTGKDQLGIVAQFSDILHRHGAQMLDIEQAACGTHSTFTLNMLVQGGANSDAMVSDMLLSSQKKNIQMNVIVVEQSSIRGDDEPEVRHALTLLKPDMGFDVIAKVAAEATKHGFNIQEIDRLSPLIPDQLVSGDSSLTAVELILGETPTTNVENFKASLATMQDELACDRALQREGAVRRNKRLVVMDMDSTLIINEVIDEIARIQGVFDQVSVVTERAMNGELDFNESLVERVKCLAGADESVFEQVYQVIQLTPGAEEFVWALRNMGYKIAVVSGGFNQVTGRVANDLGIDFSFANTLEVVGGKLTGRTIGPIVNRERKRDLLESLAQTMNIDLEQVIAIGDGANDLAMIDAAGLGIAFCAKPNVQATVGYWSTINVHRLDAALYFLGIRPKDLPPHSPHSKPTGLKR